MCLVISFIGLSLTALFLFKVFNPAPVPIPVGKYALLLLAFLTKISSRWHSSLICVSYPLRSSFFRFLWIFVNYFILSDPVVPVSTPTCTQTLGVDSSSPCMTSLIPTSSMALSKYKTILCYNLTSYVIRFISVCLFSTCNFLLPPSSLNFYFLNPCSHVLILFLI